MENTFVSTYMCTDRQGSFYMSQTQKCTLDQLCPGTLKHMSAFMIYLFSKYIIYVDFSYLVLVNLF